MTASPASRTPDFRRYRIRLFDQNGEIHTGQQPMLVLDLATGNGLRQAERRLSSLLWVLIRTDPTHASDHHDYRLRVYDWETNGHAFDWSG